MTRLSVDEVLHDIRGFGIDYSQRVPLWFASSGSQIKYNINDLTGLSTSIKGILGQNSNRRIRVVLDVISSLLMLNQPEIIYRFLAQLLEEVKTCDAVLLATLEEGMHGQAVMVSMQQLFDGVLELKLYEEGLRVLPLLRVRKMRGAPPQPGYYNFSFTSTGMQVAVYVR